MEIQIKSISFQYPDSESVFSNNSLTLNTPSDQKENLYGIIGPSGTGKTTFVSILGGQLKPNTGSIYIDGTDVYGVDDTVRRKLIAMQMQTSTALRGKVRYNLTFGLPVQDISFSELFETEDESAVHIPDEKLIDTLKKVGLWQIFESKKGLDTLIGENGLTLSGGQKQRLNFANLYLRACFYKPKLILIDEPTSSLDEISEQTITDLILELSQRATVFVVAHRIKTLDHAHGLLDTSLNKPGANLDFLIPHELLQQSQYYQALVEGKVQLDTD